MNNKMTIDEFVEAVLDGMFVDYDGYGCFATKDEVSDIVVYPSDVNDDGSFMDSSIRERFTHVEWYNK